MKVATSRDGARATWWNAGDQRVVAPGRDHHRQAVTTASMGRLHARSGAAA